MNQSIPGNGKARISSSKISKIPRSIPTLPSIKNVPSITNTIIPHHCLRSEIYKFADIQDQRMRSKRGAWNLRLSLYKMVAPPVLYEEAPSDGCPIPCCPFIFHFWQKGYLFRTYPPFKNGTPWFYITAFSIYTHSVILIIQAI